MKPQKNWLPWLGAAALLGAGGAAYWAHYRRPLPRLKGRLRIPELELPVEISRDARGIPTIAAQNWLDAWRALGLVHAQDRFFQMELSRRVTSGRLSELFGPVTLKIDRFMRRLSLLPAAQAEWDAADSHERMMLECYAQGVNACLAQQGLSSEFGVLRALGAKTGRPTAWTPVDSLLWVKMLAHDLSCNWEAELLRGRLLAHAQTAVAAAWSLNSPADLPLTLGGRSADLFDELARQYGEVREALPPGFGPSAPLGGSNAWAVAGWRSEDGRPLLANDPHLNYKIPDYWYQARIQLPGQELFGATMPGLPGVILGQNGRVSWGVTNAYIDVQDLYVERLRDDGQVDGPHGAEPLEMRIEKIHIRKQAPIHEKIYTTARGPLLTDHAPLALSLAWSLRAPGHFFRALSNLNRSENLDAALEALRDWHLPVLNFVLADTENIAHQVAGRVPRRRPYSGLTPVPAWDAAWSWQGLLDYDELPRQKNPESGMIVSANHGIAASDYPHFLSWDFNPGLRAERIEQLLLGRELHNLESFQRIQLDIGTTLGPRLCRRLAAVQVDDPRQQQALGLLSRWDGITSVDSCATSIYESTMVALGELVLVTTVGSEMAAEILGESSLNPVSPIANHASRYHAVIVLAAEKNDPRWLPPGEGNPTSRWDELLKLALALAVDRLSRRLGTDLEQWNWGRLHQLEARHPLSRLSLLFPPLGSFPIGGDSESPNQTGVAVSGGLPGPITVGASWRYLSRLADLNDSRSCHFPGQSGHPGSPNYKDGFGPWLRGEYYRPFAAAVQSRLNLTQNQQ